MDPDRVSAVLRVAPTKAWRKGERYFAGPHSGYLIGRTGTWFLATDDAVANADLGRHLDYLIGLVSAGPHDREARSAPLQELMARDQLKADVSCFWRGEKGEKPPVIPTEALEKLQRLPAEIETDFAADA